MSDEIKLDCIYCGKEKKLYVNKKKRVFHCFVCEKSGRISKLPKDILKIIGLKKTSPSKKANIEKRKLKRLVPEKEFHWAYAEARGALKYLDNLFTWEQYPHYLIIGLPLGVPLKDQEFFFGRLVVLSGPRYRYFGSTKGWIVKSFKGKVDECLIVEGFFDLCNIADDFPTIAMMGKAVEEEKVKQIISSVRKKVYIALDKDALAETIKLTGELKKSKLDVKIIHTNIFKDPGDNKDWVLHKMGRRA